MSPRFQKKDKFLISNLFQIKFFILEVNYIFVLISDFYKIKMGNSRSGLQLQAEDLIAVQNETGFTPHQIERLYSR